ncbi:hypothetical protein B0H14DRAFT_3869336 [Mycena olivaceomarginata]|nr:hypothetical protein B0H14DRAFT_3869336 [Mycena olivaceomarginata]
MDPLKPSDLGITEDWNAFKPDMKGYIPPQGYDLWPDCEDIEDQMKEFTRTKYMRDNNTPFLAMSVANSFPATRLTIRGETFIVLLSPRDMVFLATHLGNADASRHVVSGEEVGISGNASRSFIRKTHNDVLHKFKIFSPARYGGVKLQTTLVALDILANGSHQLATAAKDDNHLTTIFVILPLFTDSAEIMKVSLAIGVFAGISDARVHVAGARNVICLTYHMCVVASSGPFLVPELQLAADVPALMLWFLRGLPDSAEDLRGDDATLLCHLAPLSEEQEIDHPYKEYFESVEEIKRSRLEMSENPERPGLLTCATRMVEESADLQDRLMNMAPDEDDDDIDIVDDSPYYATVVYKHIRSASFLFVAP